MKITMILAQFLSKFSAIFRKKIWQFFTRIFWRWL